MHVFKCGAPVLDFAGTLRARRNAVPMEMLTSPESLDAWFRESGVVDADTHCEPSDVEDAVALREAIYLLVAAGLAGDTYDADALALVNDRARTPSAIPQLTQAGRRIEATGQQALSSIARQVVQLLGGPEAALLKECSRPECTQIYLDRSHGGRREWCAMDPCGNRVKAAAYRARKRTSEPRSAAAAPTSR
ncbi:ABATE domain-containing protein (plasmid) [Streptomyces sp. NBC_01136]|uniref:CGNR zinc finger domain-containing protein n=1 Tax=unclassified Streptomyces TaxID=2593676 RepID=UPI002F90E97B|nr:ABATE domain-containing protein [Streptomyces sp. NBC_01136]